MRVPKPVLVVGVALVAVLVAGCGIALPSDPPAVVPAPICEPAPGVGGLSLECEEAVAAALEVVDWPHPPITRLAFAYGPCTGPDPNAVYDCAIQLFGTVTIEFLGMLGKPVIVSVHGAADGPIATVLR